MLQDVIDLRRNNWKAGPKTLNQIHKEAEREKTQAKLMEMQPSLLMCVGSGLLSLLEHFNKNHGNCPVYDKGPKFTLPFDFNGGIPNIANNHAVSMAFTPKKLIALQRTFFEVGFVRNGLLYLWVYVLASPDEAENYVFQIKMNDGKGHEITCQETVSSLNENFEDILESEEKVFTISEKKAKKMVKDGGDTFHYSIKLKCLKDEAKDDTDEESGISDNE